MIYVKTDQNGWPLERRDEEWPEQNIVFKTEEDLTGWIVEHEAVRPVVVPDGQTDSEIWQDKLAGGWVDDVTGIKLKTTEAARNLFSGQVTMIREAIDAGILNGSVPLEIWDYNEQPHTLTVTELRGLLLRYGLAWAQMFNQYAP